MKTGTGTHTKKYWDERRLGIIDDSDWRSQESAIGQLEAIAAVPGVDALFIDLGNLSANCGHIGNPRHGDVQRLIESAIEREHAMHMPIGIVGPDPETVSRYTALGYDFVAIGSVTDDVERSAVYRTSAFSKAFCTQLRQRRGRSLPSAAPIFTTLFPWEMSHAVTEDS